MAEALYGIDESPIKLAKQKLPDEFNATIEKSYQKK